jgi:hypothetical protein
MIQRTSTAFSIVLLFASVASGAQQEKKFPLKPGEWQITSRASGGNGKATEHLFCLTDATWQKSLVMNPNCTIQNLNINSGGLDYAVTCQSNSASMKGKFLFVFDGMMHMSGTGTFEAVSNGKFSTVHSETDFHWKSATCGPADENLRPAQTH